MTKADRKHVPEIGQPIYMIRPCGLLQSFDADIYRGETARSWLVGISWRPSKIPKKSAELISKETYDLLTERQRWIWQHARHIVDMVRALDVPDYSKLKQIAEIVGYQEGK